MAETSIEWTASHTADGREFAGYSFNGWMGCTQISDGCAHCYAKAAAERIGRDFGKLTRTGLAYWQDPYKWNRRAEKLGVRFKVFTQSIADFWDNQAPAQWRYDQLNVMRSTEWLDWLILTKRPQNIQKMLEEAMEFAYQNGDKAMELWLFAWLNSNPPHNVWLGTSVEDQGAAVQRIAHLLSVHAVVHFLSVEPLLGYVNLEEVRLPNGMRLNALTGFYAWPAATGLAGAARMMAELPKPPNGCKIGWVIAGGESGPQARVMNPAWLMRLRDQCVATKTPFFFKQWGEYAPRLPAYEGEDIKPLDTDQLVEFADGGGYVMRKFGKKKAGASLFGQEYREFPIPHVIARGEELQRLGLPQMDAWLGSMP